MCITKGSTTNVKCIGKVHDGNWNLEESFLRATGVMYDFMIGGSLMCTAECKVTPQIYFGTSDKQSRCRSWLFYWGCVWLFLS